MKKIKIIVIGHGLFASGIKSSLTLFMGEQDSANFIDFTKSMTDEDLRVKIESQITNKEEIVLFTDIVGGTPYKEAAKIAYKCSDVGVVAGCNVSSLLESAYKEYQNKEDLMEDLVNISKKTAKIFDKNIVDDTQKEIEDFTDGI